MRVFGVCDECGGELDRSETAFVMHGPYRCIKNLKLQVAALKRVLEQEPVSVPERGSGMSHFKEICELHGSIRTQCRCADRNKTVRKIACGPYCPSFVVPAQGEAEWMYCNAPSDHGGHYWTTPLQVSKRCPGKGEFAVSAPIRGTDAE